MAAPGTRPPPSTRSSSGTPLDRNADSSTDTWPIGTAARLHGAAAARMVGAAASATDPQSWHSPQRPTHLEVSHPHSLQRNVGRGVLGMGRTLRHWSDNDAY